MNERWQNIRVSGVYSKTTHALLTTKAFEYFWCIEMDTQLREYPGKVKILDNFGEAIPE